MAHVQSPELSLMLSTAKKKKSIIVASGRQVREALGTRVKDRDRI
jgi:hypothetical protein